jgi:hypothetical protein
MPDLSPENAKLLAQIMAERLARMNLEIAGLKQERAALLEWLASHGEKPAELVHLEMLDDGFIACGIAPNSTPYLETTDRRDRVTCEDCLRSGA